MAVRILFDNIPVEIKRKRIKNMYLYVKAPRGTVVASVPVNVSQSEIENFISPRMDWVRKQREKLQNRDIVLDKKFGERDTVFIFGEPYKIIYRHAGTQSAEASNNVLVLNLRKGHSPESRERVIREFMRSKLYEKINERLPIYTEMTGLYPSDLQIKDMDTRWGSCNIKTKKIWINLKLAYMPVEYLDYILIHEVAHLKISGHGADFSSFLDRYMINWREIKKELNRRYMEFI